MACEIEFAIEMGKGKKQFQGFPGWLCVIGSMLKAMDETFSAYR